MALGHAGGLACVRHARQVVAACAAPAEWPQRKMRFGSPPLRLMFAFSQVTRRGQVLDAGRILELRREPVVDGHTDEAIRRGPQARCCRRTASPARASSRPRNRRRE